jgi:acyl dehydratase
MSAEVSRWDEIAEGVAIPALIDEITARRVIQNPGATGDYFPGHWDPEYARRQGQRAIYANSLHIYGLLDRAVGEWAGPACFLLRRNVRLLSSMYAGDTVTVTGVVAGKRVDGDTRIVDVDLTLTNQDGGVICRARSTVRMPETAQGQDR